MVFNEINEPGGRLAHERDVAVPAGLQPHLLAEDARAQLVLLAEVHEPNARPLQPLDELYHIALRLILHSHHAYEHLPKYRILYF